MNTVNIGLSETKIAQLINEGYLCAADIQCLDKSSKKIIWQLCLWCCQNRIHCKQVACHQNEHEQSQDDLLPVF